MTSSVWSPLLELVAYLHRQQVLIKLLMRYTWESYPLLHELPFVARFQELECKGILQLPGQCLAWICMQLKSNMVGLLSRWYGWTNGWWEGCKFITIALIRHSAPGTVTLSYPWRNRGHLPPNLGSYSSYSEGLF